MKLRLPLAMVLAAGLTLLFGVNGCDTDETDNITTDGPPGVDVTGTWTGSYTSSTTDSEDETETTSDFTLTMTMNADGEVEGIASWLGRFTGDVTGNRFTIDASDFFATVSGNSMTGTFTDAATGEPVTFTATKH